MLAAFRRPGDCLVYPGFGLGRSGVGVGTNTAWARHPNYPLVGNGENGLVLLLSLDSGLSVVSTRSRNRN